MQRPVMHPTFGAGSEPPAPKKSRNPFGLLWRVVKFFGRILLAHPFGGGNKPQFRNEEGTRLSRVIRGFTYRLAFVPVLLVAFLTALVFAATHPGRTEEGPDPSSFGVYYDPVNFISDDGARLEGWLIPVLDAKRVLEEGDALIGKKYPAVVLVHDFAGSRQQLLPMVNPLHKAGFVVLAINLRGAASLSGQAQTFGIKEALDVKAAVDMLRRRAFVDEHRIAVVGIGTGANAALIAGRDDAQIAALVLAAPVDGFDAAFAERVGQDRRWLPPLRPLFRWTFQAMYGVDAEELNVAKFAKTLQSRPVLMTDARQGVMESSSVRGMRQFLQKHVGDKATAPAGGATAVVPLSK
jgi:pimeloyl-ACP methyl ester carboxylesterase